MSSMTPLLAGRTKDEPFGANLAFGKPSKSAFRQSFHHELALAVGHKKWQKSERLF
jgi:hypothetical protein